MNEVERVTRRLRKAERRLSNKKRTKEQHEHEGDVRYRMINRLEVLEECIELEKRWTDG